MKEKVILTDCDGVLCNWNHGFDEFMNAKGHTQLPDTDHLYSLVDRYGLTHERTFELIVEFNESSYIAHLEPFADSVEYVAKLADLGFKFTVVTSISDKPSALDYRTMNLHNIFGDVFAEINCIELDTSKYSTLKRWAGTGYFWIEDHMRQAEAGYENGLNTVLIDHPYNAHYQTDLFPRVSYETPWREIYYMVREEYGI